MRYVQTMKIKKAKEMLCGDASSVTEIACSLGFGNVYEFSREFKKLVHYKNISEYFRIVIIRLAFPFRL